MFPSALANSAPIPFVLDLTLEFGPVLLLALLALLDLSAVALLHAALTTQRTQFSESEDKPAASRYQPTRSSAGRPVPQPSRAAQVRVALRKPAG